MVSTLGAGTGAGTLIALAWSSPAAASTTDELARDDLGVAAVAIAVAGWIVFLGVRERWGREARPRTGANDDARTSKPLDDPPALVDALHHRGQIRPETVGAIILDLARRGYLTIVEDRRGGFLGGDTEWRFRREETPRDSLRPYENAVYTRLFATGSDVWLSELESWARANRQQARVFVDRIQRYLAGDLGERGYVERGRRLPSIINLSAAGLVLLVALAALINGALIGLLALASGAGQVALTRRLRRRTASGTDRAQDWREVAETLAAIADAEEPPAESAEEWERCLVYAVTLDVFDEFLAGLKTTYPSVVDDEAFAAWYQSVRTDGHRLDSVDRFVRSLTASLSHAVEPPRVPSKLVATRR